jgi:hypothetical protein
MTDTEILELLRGRLEWTGSGYWLPDICVKEQDFGASYTSEPTLDEFRTELVRLLTGG